MVDIVIYECHVRVVHRYHLHNDAVLVLCAFPTTVAAARIARVTGDHRAWRARSTLSMGTAFQSCQRALVAEIRSLLVPRKRPAKRA
jgi:hypothetical protein